MIEPSARRLKVLVTAHEISPILGSECASGWNIITRLGSFHDVTVLYAESNQFGTNNYKEHIDSFILKNGEVPGVEFIAIPQPSITTKIAKLNKKFSDKKTSVGLSILYFWGVTYWEKRVFLFVSQLIKERHFDLMHHFNHLSFREPGYLWEINKPFIWGPTSGLSRVPIAFLYSLPLSEFLYNILRNFLNTFQIFINVRIRKAINKSRLIYFVTSDDGSFFGKKKCKIKNLLDMGAYEVVNYKEKLPHLNPIKALWVGRFSFLKALDILLGAIDSSDILRKHLELTIIGDGPQKEYFNKLASDLNLDNIKWLGQIPKERVFEIMQESDILVHTSIKEAASAVILESISAGLPVVCHDSFGMSFAIDEKCGIKVPFISPKKSIEGFALALEKICNDPHLVNELSVGALHRAKELSWDSIAETIAKDYNKIYENQ
jgi:glycosyltransferase involved in cell wall biosynthesis